LTTFNGKEINKNTVVGLSLGTIVVIVVFVWTALGIGRPLFASDLESISHDIETLATVIDSNQKTTAIQIINIRKSSLQSELRIARRDSRTRPNDQNALDDVHAIEAQIKELEQKILCYRTVSCIVEADF